MKLTMENRTRNWVRGYENNELRVADRNITHHCLISMDAIAPWNVDAELTLQSLEPVLALNPEVVILGLADSSKLPAAAVYATFLERGIGFEVMTLGAACRTFNVLVGEGRHAVLAVLLAPGQQMV